MAAEGNNLKQKAPINFGALFILVLVWRENCGGSVLTIYLPYARIENDQIRTQGEQSRVQSFVFFI